MGEVAVAAARSVDYVNAGTIEFLVDRDKNFYFLEMNTRVQVEHPVTELVTGIDIVQEQLRIALALPPAPAPGRRGHQRLGHRVSHQRRRPVQQLPAVHRRFTSVQLPTGPGVRVDTGVFEGNEISPYYDSMISKLVCYGETRGEAVLRMRRALEEYRIMGVKNQYPVPPAHDGQPPLHVRTIRYQVRRRPFQHGRPRAGACPGSSAAGHAGRPRTEPARGPDRCPGARDTSNWKWLSRWERAAALSGSGRLSLVAGTTTNDSRPTSYATRLTMKYIATVKDR